MSIWRSLCLYLSTAGGGFSCWWLSETLIYGYRRASLGLILMLCFFSRTSVFGFPPGTWHPSSVRHGLHLVECLESSQIVVGNFHNVCSTVALEYHADRSPLVSGRVNSGVGGCLSPLVVWKVCLNTLVCFTSLAGFSDSLDIETLVISNLTYCGCPSLISTFHLFCYLKYLNLTFLVDTGYVWVTVLSSCMVSVLPKLFCQIFTR